MLPACKLILFFLSKSQQSENSCCAIEFTFGKSTVALQNYCFRKFNILGCHSTFKSKRSWNKVLPGKDTTFPLLGHTESLYAWDTSPGTQKKKVFKYMLVVRCHMLLITCHLSYVVMAAAIAPCSFRGFNQCWCLSKIYIDNCICYQGGSIEHSLSYRKQGTVVFLVFNNHYKT